MTEILLGPTLSDAPTLKVTDKTSGKVFYKKQILPEGKFKYNGKELDLGPDVHKAAVQSFKDKAFDEVTFQLPTEQGGHNADPTLRKGTLANVEYVPGKGSFGYFDLDPAMAAHVEKYPRFGVSPRLFLDHERMDGKKFAVAYQHVVGTDLPRAAGMDAWSKVELSEDHKNDTVYDFSTEVVEGVSLGLPSTQSVVTVVPTDINKKEGEDVSGLSPEMLAFMTQLKKDYEELENGGGDGTPTPTPTVTIPETVSLSLNTHAEEIAALKAANVKSEWATKRSELLRAGVPPHQIDLATPIMEKVEATVIDLSTAEGVVKSSDKQQVLSLLETMKGTIDFSETGHGAGANETEQFSDDDINGFLEHFNI